MTLPFTPTPGIFPAANVMLSPASAALFEPKQVSQPIVTWEQQYHALYPIIFGSDDYVGRIIHVYKVPWSNEDGWAVIDGYSVQNSTPIYTILGLDIPSHELYYSYTIGTDVPYTIGPLWNRLRDIRWYAAAGAIRWGTLWLETLLKYLTHDTDVMHFNGLPQP